MNNREVGVIIENDAVGKYYTDVFLYDWNSMIEHIGTATVFAFSSLSGCSIKGSGELARLEFTAIGEVETKSAISIQGIMGNLDVEPIEASWVDSVVSVMHVSAQ